jgi:hypothetical protein
MEYDGSEGLLILLRGPDNICVLLAAEPEQGLEEMVIVLAFVGVEGDSLLEAGSSASHLPLQQLNDPLLEVRLVDVRVDLQGEVEDLDCVLEAGHLGQRDALLYQDVEVAAVDRQHLVVALDGPPVLLLDELVVAQDYVGLLRVAVGRDLAPQLVLDLFQFAHVQQQLAFVDYAV